MKDYSLLKYFAKLGKDYKITKDSITTSFLYGESLIDVDIIFKRKRSVGVMYLLDDVYDEYAHKIYSSLNEFVVAFSKKYGFYEVGYADEKDKNSVYLSCNLMAYKLDNVASQAFADMRVLVNSLNEFLNLNEENYFDEEGIRAFHRKYLKRQENKMKLLLIGGIVGFALGIFLVVKNSGGVVDNPLLLMLGILLTICSPIASIIFALRSKFYKSQINKSKKNRR